MELMKRFRSHDMGVNNNRPEGCVHPDCFHCIFDDCIWDGRLGYDPIRQRAELEHKIRNRDYHKKKGRTKAK
nr:MAG TPA: hypothetical protein [Caudoviricetes sp.]